MTLTLDPGESTTELTVAGDAEGGTAKSPTRHAKILAKSCPYSTTTLGRKVRSESHHRVASRTFSSANGCGLLDLLPVFLGGTLAADRQQHLLAAALRGALLFAGDALLLLMLRLSASIRSTTLSARGLDCE
jgi:hypothetical protein